MKIDHFRGHCLFTKDSKEELAFEKNTLALKVIVEIFALCNMITFEFRNLKCDSEKAVMLR